MKLRSSQLGGGEDDTMCFCAILCMKSTTLNFLLCRKSENICYRDLEVIWSCLLLRSGSVLKLVQTFGSCPVGLWKSPRTEITQRLWPPVQHLTTFVVRMLVLCKRMEFLVLQPVTVTPQFSCLSNSDNGQLSLVFPKTSCLQTKQV